MAEACMCVRASACLSLCLCVWMWICVRQLPSKVAPPGVWRQKLDGNDSAIATHFTHFKLYRKHEPALFKTSEKRLVIFYLQQRKMKKTIWLKVWSKNALRVWISNFYVWFISVLFCFVWITSVSSIIYIYIILYIP